ncbi:MAG: hypothetical protein P0Y62_05390 [Candidatus Chryseobacterium colombiense]|nr:hypothetical protein [Chryseobacterium sp.]WEK70990.1 MAG: hypothetical protein P0Y62_05390 [Chryseobacterium sp.]
MKESLKNKYIHKKIFFIFLFMTQLCFSQIQNSKKDFYTSLDERISIFNENDEKYFLEISFFKECKNETGFRVRMLTVIDTDYSKYKIYKYNGVIILYDINSVKNLKWINFFDSYFKKSKDDINTIFQRGNQSLMFSYIMYFKNKKFIKDTERTHDFFIKGCN